MRKTLSAALAFCLASGTALACDDHIGKCQIEEWRHDYTPVMQALTIEGVATCDTGWVRIRLYDGEGEARKFLGVETALIEGHIFKTIKLPAARPRDLSIKYSIQPR